MKTFLIPTLALFALPLFAQEIAAPGAGTPPPPTAPGRVNPTPAPPRPEEKAPGALPALRNPVQFGATTVKSVIEILNSFLEGQNTPPLNVVVTPEVENVPVPAMMLQNVTANDVLNVIAKVTGLSVEPVNAESGKVAAWVIAPPKANFGVVGIAPGGMMGGFGGGGLARGGAPVVDTPVELTVDSPAVVPAPPPGNGPVAGSAQFNGMPSGAGNFSGSYIRAGGAGSIGGGGGSVAWVDPAANPAVPPQINRVIGIARIYGDITNEQERADKESLLVKMLDDITEVQKLKCDVRLYGQLHILVVKGSPEAVELVEQTISAMKENIGVSSPRKLPGTGANKF